MKSNWKSRLILQRAIVRNFLLVTLMVIAACKGQKMIGLSKFSKPITAAEKQYLATFDLVWQTVNDQYFDPTFGGLDWNAARDRYKPLIAAAENDEQFHELVNKMLFELDVSHIGVVGPDELEQIDPVLSAEGTLGIDVRLIDGQAVITRVEPGSSGSEAGLRMGLIIQSIDGETVEEIIAGMTMIPPLNDRNRRKRTTCEILERLYGPADSKVVVVYLDEHGQSHTRSIVRSRRAGVVVIKGVPPFFPDFVAKRLNRDIGYIRFNAFTPPVDQRFSEAVDSMSDISGLIIDLRGNHGGVFGVRKALAEKLVARRTRFWTYEYRDTIQEVYLDPAERVYAGPVVVLIDALSVSSAEEFSGGLQAIDRVTVIGEHSPGIVLTMAITQLPSGTMLLYPKGRTRTADGSILEGNGVTPDLLITHDRDLLLQGIDSQLRAAITYLEQRSDD